MKKNICIRVFITWILFSSIILSAPTLTIYYYDRMPYYGKFNNKVEGILVDISKMIFEEAGINYKFVYLPSKRVLENLKINGNTCALGWFKTEEREAIYSYSNDFIYQDKPYAVLVNKSKSNLFPDNPTIKNILESNLNLGVIDGYVYGTWLDDMIKKYPKSIQKIVVGSDSGVMYKMISAGRFDYMFTGLEEAKYAINTSYFYEKNITLVNIADAPKGNMRYILFSKGIDKTILSKINDAIPKVKASEEYKKIIQNIKNNN